MKRTPSPQEKPTTLASSSRTVWWRGQFVVAVIAGVCAVFLVLSSCAKPDPRLVRKRTPRAPLAQGERPPGRGESGTSSPAVSARDRLLDSDRSQERTRVEDYAGAVDVQVLDEGTDVDELRSEIIEQGVDEDAAAALAQQRRKEAENAAAAEAEAAAQLRAEIERRQKEEAEAKLRARQEQARRSEEEEARSGEAARKRESTQQALAELGGEGNGEDLGALEKRIEARRSYLDRYRRQGSAVATTSVIPTMMHELADLYVRYANERFLRDMTVFDANEALCKAGKSGCRSDVGLPVKDFSEAIALYEELLSKYPDRADNDKVLVQLSFAYQEMGESDKGEQVLVAFLKDHPKDPRSQAAWFRLGLSYSERTMGADIFEAEPWLEKAIDAYERAIQYDKDTYYYSQSLFQLGWASFRLNNFQKCVEWMDALVRKIIDDEKKKGKFTTFDALYQESAGLVREAIKFMAIAWSEMGDGKSGPKNLAAFWNNAPKGVHEQYTYIALGEFYEKEERYEEAIDIYRRMIQKYPTYPSVPRVLELVVTVYEKDKRWELVNEARRDIIRHLEPNGSWWRANDAQAQKLASEIRSRAVFQLGQYHHAKAQQKDTKDAKEQYGLAAENYKLFLQDYKDHQDAPEALFLLAEVHFSLDRFQEAALEYETVAWEKPNEKRKDLAAYKAVVSWTSALDMDLAAIEAKKKETQQPYDRATGLKESKFTPRLIAAVDRFVTAYPEHKDVADLLFNEGEILYSTKQYERAREVYRGVIAKYPKDPRSLEAQEYIATTYLEAGDQVAAEGEYRKALAMTPKTKAEDERRTKLRTLIAAAVYKQGEQFKEKGDLTNAAKQFLRVPNDPELRDVEIAPTAFFDGAIAYRDANLWNDAIAAFRALDKQYPDSEFGPKGLALIGSYYRDQKELPKAADAFIEASAAFERQKNMDKAEELYYVAGKMYEELEDWDRALQSMRNYTKKFGVKPKRLVEAKYIEGYAAYRREKYSEAEKAWAELFKLYASLEKKNPDLPATFPAKAKFLLADRALQSYLSVQITLPLRKSLKNKQKLLTNVIQMFGEAAQYKVEEYTTGATYKIGEALMNFRDAILKSERPKEVKKDELLMEEYGYALEEQAFPFEEKAIDTFKQNVLYSRKHEVYGEWIDKSFEKLAVLVPGRYAKNELGEGLPCKILTFAPVDKKVVTPAPVAPAPSNTSQTPAPQESAPASGAGKTAAAPDTAAQSAPAAEASTPTGTAKPAKSDKPAAAKPAKKKGEAKKQ